MTMRLMQVLGAAGLGILLAAAPLTAIAGDAPAADEAAQPAPDAAAAPDADGATAGEGIPADGGTSDEDSDTAIEGEDPQK